MSELLKNVERSLYTFNFNNMVEICYDKVIKFDTTKGRLSDTEKIMLDNCIDKYMMSFNIVKDTTLSHLDKLFSNK